MRGRPRFPSRTEPKVRINEKIRSPRVRAIAPGGEQLGIIDVGEALRKARELELDLVEVAPNSDPPVCKIMDYGKYRYEESKKQHERKKKQATVTVKEIKLRPKTEMHDLSIKAKKLMRFLGEGCKVKVTIMFRGREITHPEQARLLVAKLLDIVGEEGRVEQPAKFEGRNMTMLIGPTD
ncbi:translation initiation factor IF-3 [Thermodesulfobacteriota bacterium]